MEPPGIYYLIISTYVVCYITYWVIRRWWHYKMFERNNIPGPRPAFLAGNLYQLKSYNTPMDAMSFWLQKYGNVLGYFMGMAPYVIVKDLDMLKQIFVKDFHVFSNRPPMHANAPPFNKTILALKDRRWKEVRNILTPTFSSKKIKLMTNIMDKKVDITVAVVTKKATNDEMFDIFQLVQALTLDVITDCALAMKTNCQGNPEDDFLVSIQKFFRLGHSSLLEASMMLPVLKTVLPLAGKFLSRGKTTITILENVKKSITARKENPNMKSMDMLQLMLDHRNHDVDGDHQGMSDDEIIANAFVFLLAGFETTATALAFTFHFLIKYPEIQEKLYQEIAETEDASYNTIQNLQYLDQVFCESLRYYPPVTGFITRNCSESNYRLGNVTIPKGANVLAPIWDIQHDPDIWPDPWKFDPDRFSLEKKKTHHSMAYMPFGLGPRNCIGARFAQLEAKLTIFKLLKNFKFMACEKTDDPLQLICPTVMVNPANGIWLRAVMRTENI